MRLLIGVVSAETDEADEEMMIKCIQLGRAVARHGMILLTGADAGLPYAATRGAQAAGGMVIGLSPAGSREEHEHVYHLIVDGFDALLFTGVGNAGKLLEVIRSVDIVVVVGSGRVTLTTCATAHALGKLVGVLSSGSATQDRNTPDRTMPDASTSSRSLFTAAPTNDLFLDAEPIRLIDRLACASQTKGYVRPGVILPPPSAPYTLRQILR